LRGSGLSSILSRGANRHMIGMITRLMNIPIINPSKGFNAFPLLVRQLM
jgi:hypothetical protein